MRIIGQIPHPELGITIFKSGNKIILKVEIGPFEQTYRFLETDQMSRLEDMERILTAEILPEFYKVFDLMNNHYKQLTKNI